MQSIAGRHQRVRLRRAFCIVLEFGLVSAMIASCTNGGSASHRSNNSVLMSASTPSQPASHAPQATPVQPDLSSTEATRVHTWLACQTELCQIGPGGGLRVTPPLGSGGGLAPPDTAPVARFDWSMPARFDASWHAWKPYDSFD